MTRVHNTVQELRFLNGLAAKKDAAKRLAGYLSGAAKRADWGSVDAAAAIGYAEQLKLRAEARL